jgi:transcriptional regulator with XRE-family HTH domain/tetratricopeptide (TPR) repeat protein
MEETALPGYFGGWLKHRRKELDLTQAELAKRASCSVPTLRKIESGERRPSRQLAGLLARSLEIPTEDQTTFIKVARGELNVERLRFPSSFHAIHHSINQKPSNSRINLPFQPTQFIGREAELAGLGKLLADPQCRLLTVTGMGGIGKTRMAIEAAYFEQNNFPDGVIFVTLAALKSPTFIVSAILDALGLNLAGPQDPLLQLLNALRDKKLLLVLDNVEHLLDGVGLFTEMLQNSPLLKLMVTSRERLNLHGEWVFEIQGLPVPPDDKATQVEQYSSVALFNQRAKQVKADFNPTPAEQAWAVHICRIVEGMPLAIELAAAWVGMLTCQEISQEIEANLDILQTNMRDIPLRHQSMKATFDHSWNRLNAEEQAVFEKLSVFQGGFTRHAAERVAEASLPILSALIAKSLIYRKSDTHYDMHQLIQQYAAHKLQQDARIHTQTREQHRQYFMDFLFNLHPDLRGPNMQAALKTIRSDLDNVREAWQRTVAERRFNGLRQAEKCLYDFFDLSDRILEGYSIISYTVEGLRAEYINHPNDIELQTLLGLLLVDQSFFGSYFMKQSEVIDLARQGYEFLRDGNDQPAFGYSVLWLAQIDNRLGDLNKVEKYNFESLEIFKRCGDERGVAAALGSQARLALSLGHFDEGARAAKRAETIYRRFGEEESICRTLIIQGELALHTGQYDRAKNLLDEALMLSRSTGISSQTGIVLGALAQLAQYRNQLQEARDLIEESLVFLSDHDAVSNRAMIFRRFGDVLSAQGNFQEAQLWICKSLQLLVALEFNSPALDVLLDYARLLSRQGYFQRASGLALFLMGEPRVRPLTKYYAEQIYAELLPRLSEGQIQTVKEYAQNRAFEAIVYEIIQSSDIDTAQLSARTETIIE